MAKDTKRSRSSKWSHEETLALANLKREASLSKETGDGMWKRISQQISRRFLRSDDQCRRRWDTLVKVNKKIETYCDKNEKDHWQLNDNELASLKLDTEYGGEWYSIVQEVMRSKESRGRGMSNGSNTGSHSDSLFEHSPARDTLLMSPQASTSESSSAHDNVRRPTYEDLKNRLETKEWHTDGPDIWIPPEDETGIEPRLLERECPSHHQQYGAVNIAGAMGINRRHAAGGSRHVEGFDWDTNDSNMMALYQHLFNLKISTVSKSTSIVLDGTISGQASGRSEIIQGLEQADSEADEQSQPCALQVIELEVFPCCDSCIRKWTKKLEDMGGVEKPVLFDRANMKVSVTATAEPEDVLKQVQLVKKSAVMWPRQK